MAEREKRDKAKDVWMKERSAWVSDEKVEFSKAFPELASMRVEVTEFGAGTRDYSMEPGPMVFTDADAGEFINCHNPLCYNGGFRLGLIIRAMVSDRLEEKSLTKSCQGSEGSPKGRRIYRKCANHFEIRAQLTYREPAADTSGSPG